MPLDTIVLKVLNWGLLVLLQPTKVLPKPNGRKVNQQQLTGQLFSGQVKKSSTVIS